MSELREIVQEITDLGADDGGMLSVSANRLRKWRHRILALLDESEPVALVKWAGDLATMAIQSDRYARDPMFGEAVDMVLAYTALASPTPTPAPEGGGGRYTTDEIVEALYEAEKEYSVNLVGSLSDILISKLRAPEPKEEG